MSTLDLGEFDTAENRKQAGLRLLAHMAFPALDEQAVRRQFLASVMALALDNFDSFLSKVDNDSVKEALYRRRDLSWQYRLLVEVGELKTLASAPGLTSLANALLKSVFGWIVAGDVLLLITTVAHHHLDVRGGASINKAIHLMTFQMDEMGYRGARNEKDLRKTWKRFKPVAHLCAAWVLVLSGTGDLEAVLLKDQLAAWPFVPFRNERDLVAMLAWARAFQKFGTKFIPHAQNSPILEPSAIWSIPDDLLLPRAELKISPLSQELQEALKRYRAPKKV